MRGLFSLLEDPLQFEPLMVLARSRCERLEREARHRRLLRRVPSAAASPRRRLGRFVRTLGSAAISLGDALAKSR
jgi:hypothetical protein